MLRRGANMKRGAKRTTPGAMLTNFAEQIGNGGAFIVLVVLWSFLKLLQGGVI
jgi:hypothetical protein